MQDYFIKMWNERRWQALKALKLLGNFCYRMKLDEICSKQTKLWKKVHPDKSQHLNLSLPCLFDNSSCGDLWPHNLIKPYKMHVPKS